MTTVVPLLERLACNPYGDDAFADAVAVLDPALRAALLHGDVAGLVAAAGGRPVMACMVATPEHDAPQPDEQPFDDEPTEPRSPDSQDA